MAYYVAVQKKNGNYLGINIKESGYFDKPFSYKEIGACTLEEIDRYTTRYPYEVFFKRCILSEGILSIDDINQPLVIYYYKEDENGKEERKVSDYILYKDSKKYIENPLLVIDYVLKKAHDNDYIFFRKLADTIPVNQICASSVTKIALLLERNTINGNNELKSDIYPSFGDEMITEVIKLLIYNNRIIPNSGTVTYTKEINFESFHNLLVFISNYEKELAKDKASGYKKSLKSE